MTLEAYFHKDPRIEEWIDQITEKVFTVCLLSGLDSEAEFQRGCQIVAKVTLLLQEIPTFPEEYLDDGLKQLVEQQLPDARVINNFPAFQATMDKMLREGIAKALESTKGESLKSQTLSMENDDEQLTEDHEQNAGIAVIDPNEESLTECAIPALASGSITCPEIRGFEDKSEGLGPEAAMIPRDTILLQSEVWEISASKAEVEVEPLTTSKAYGILRTSQVPESADQLKRVLSNVFPNSVVCWNMKLKGQTFLAQVEDILIYLFDAKQPCQIDDFTNEGWKVYVCSAEDLLFPRRLERGIRQIQRSGKKPQIV
jgi:hypothetical protein